MTNNEPTTAENSPADPVPLAHLVLEGLAATVDELADRLGPGVLVDDVGRRCTTRETARCLFAEKAEAEEQREAVRARNQEKLDRATAEAHAAILPGVPAPEGLGGQGLTALEVLTADEKLERLENAGSHYDELFTGASYYHSLAPREEGER